MSINEAITARIHLLCKKKKLSVNKLAKLSNINQSTVAEIIAGRSRYPMMKTIKKLADGFGMTLSEFFDDEIFNNLDDEEKTN